MAETPRGEMPQQEKDYIPESETRRLTQQYDTLQKELTDILNPGGGWRSSSDFWRDTRDEERHPLSSSGDWAALAQADEWLRTLATRFDRLKELFEAKTQAMRETIDALSQLPKDTLEKREQGKKSE